jgi:uncharacterized membrane-anchored protein YjiN (DUF445 family)
MTLPPPSSSAVADHRLAAPGVAVALTEADLAKGAALRRMKWIAAGLLVAAAMVFVLTRALTDGKGVSGYVEAFAEAAMVGALADWFAVTALFRHPLGLPIPHTAIIPKRKDQIGRTLGEFVQGEFMTPEVISQRLRGFGVAGRLGSWLSDDANAVRASAALGDAMRAALEVLDDEEVQTAIEQIVERRVRATPIAPLVGRMIDIGVDGGHHQQLLDAILTSVGTFLDDNTAVMRQKLERESPWWVPESIDDRIFAKILNGVQSFLDEVGGDHHHPMRRSIDDRVATFAERLRTDPAMLAKGEELKEQVLAHPEVRAWLASLWGELKRNLDLASGDPSSELRGRLTVGVQRLGHRLATDPELAGKVDDWVQRAVTHIVGEYRGEVADLIATTVERWDAESTSRKMELQVGRDLQFIRINGTIVGGLAGVVIHALSTLVF